MVRDRQSGVILLAVVAALVVSGTGLGLAATPAAGSTEGASIGVPSAAAGEPAAANATATYRLEPAGPGEVRVTVSVALPDTADSVTVGFAPSEFRLRSWTGSRSEFVGDFSSVAPEGGAAATYRAPADGDRVELSYTVAGNVSNVVFDGLDAAATDDWALVPRRLLLPSRIAVDGTALGADAIAYEFGAYGDGHVGEGYAFLGPHERRPFTAGDERITVVVPATVDDAGEELIQRTVSTTAAELRVGGRNEAVTAFVAPPALRPGGRTVLADFWVNADPRDDIPAHEYVHTRQAFEAGSGMRWFVEGSAQYYGLRAALATGDLSTAAFRAELTDVDSGGTLTAPLVGWESPQTPYEKGALVLAALDARIRAASDGDRTLQYVVAKMNAHEGPVGEEQFRSFVAEAAGESQDDWLDRYVDGSATPTLPDDDAAFTFVESGDADGDGLTDRREVVLGTDPATADTDGDGLPDGEDGEPLVPQEDSETTTTTAPPTDEPGTATAAAGTATPGGTTPEQGSTATATASSDGDPPAAGEDGGTTTGAGSGTGGGAPGPGLLGAAGATLAGVWLALRRARR